MKENSNNLVTSIKKGIGGTFTFSGKSNRFEYITYFIFLLGVYIGSLFLLFEINEEGLIFLIWSIFSIVCAISLTTLIARRLGDMGHNKWIVIIGFIPIIGLFLPFYLMIFKSKVNFIILFLFALIFPFIALYILIFSDKFFEWFVGVENILK
tara:strand:- start:28 stop:486 length:459 start_codon:yes stop_codon:yes gene_type:complete